MPVVSPSALEAPHAAFDLLHDIHPAGPGIDVPGTPDDDNLSASADDDTMEGLGGFDSLFGLGGNDTIDGGADDDTLIGGAGADHLIGGDGSDWASYEDATAGVTASLADSGANTGDAAGDTYDTIENLLGSSHDDVLTGDGGVNSLSGGDGADTITGGDGDYFNGGIGDDDITFTGGAGQIVFGGDGTDVLHVTGDTTSGLAAMDVESCDIAAGVSAEVDAGNDMSFTLLGAATLTSGGAGDDTIMGSSGDDVIDGGGGADSIQGGDGADLFRSTGGTDSFDGGSGVDTLSFEGIAFAASVDLQSGLVINDGTGSGFNETITGVENLIGGDSSDTLNGDTQDNSISGGAGDDFLRGRDGADTLDGGTGGDSMFGGNGDDTYYLDSGADGVIESSGAGTGTDTVHATIGYTLASNVENLVLEAGAGGINGFGNSLANEITGNESNNSIGGGAGDDTIDGGLGADIMEGGADNDTYLVDNVGDQVGESSGEGTDLVISTVSFTLGAEVENLELAAGAGAINGFGNGSDNLITGNESANSLDGGAGADTLDGGLGADTMSGGANDDTYYVDNLSDVVSESAAGGTDTIRSSVSLTLGSEVENLVLVSGAGAINGVGNDGSNQITGNESDNSLSGGGAFDILQGGAGADTLDGGTGGDSLSGGDGNDVYYVDNGSDVVIEGSGAESGADTVYSTIGYALGANVEDLILMSGAGALAGTGNTLDNYIAGNESGNSISGGDGDDTLDGGAGADTLSGGIGDDTYVVDEAADQVSESGGGGTDTVRASISYTLALGFENLELNGGAGDITGTGNSADNQITGNEGANTLDGGTGADTLTGGSGDDRYVVDNAGDQVVESFFGGTDTVQASVGYTLAAWVENLELSGGVGLKGNGNALDNHITGTTGDDTLYGGSGSDTLTGGQGDDVYIVRDADAVVVENGGEGNDLVRATVGYTLASGVNRLTLVGSAGLAGTGNNGANILLSGAGADTLDGGGGDDTLRGRGGDDHLTGGAGQDRMSGDGGSDSFVFLAGDSPDATPDRILDFEVGVDHIDLSGLDDSAGALHFSSGRHLTGEAGQVIAYAGHSASFVKIDLDGDGLSDLTIALNHSPTLSAADFVF